MSDIQAQEKRAPYVDVYSALWIAGLATDEVASHESDLYVRNTPQNLAIIKASGWSHTFFASQVDGSPWIEVPFGYTPWWEARRRA